jgi:hypothetical protein
MSNVKRIVVAAAVGTVVIFVLAGLAFGLLFADFFTRHFPAEFAAVNRAAPSYLLILVSDAVYAVMLAILLLLARAETFGRGALVGLLLGFAVVLHFDLLSRATTHLTTPVGIMANVAISSVMSATAGGVVGAVLGRLHRR